MDDKLDFGEVAGLRIDVISETGWFDDAIFKKNMTNYGGTEQTQYRIAWDRENAGGYSALLTVTSLDGEAKDPARHRLEYGVDGQCLRPAWRRPHAGARRDRPDGALARAPRPLLGHRVDA